MPKLDDVIYQANLWDLTEAVSSAVHKTFVDDDDRLRVTKRILGEIDRVLVAAPNQKAPEAEDKIEVPILDKSYSTILNECLVILEGVSDYRKLALEARMLTYAWGKAHFRLDFRDLFWDGWLSVMVQMSDFMDARGSGKALNTMSIAWTQWRHKVEEAGVPDVYPIIAPFHHLYVDIVIGQEKVITDALEISGCPARITLVNMAPKEKGSARYLLTLLSPNSFVRVQEVLATKPVKVLIEHGIDPRK
jgi:hypothetical protein